MPGADLIKFIFSTPHKQINKCSGLLKGTLPRYFRAESLFLKLMQTGNLTGILEESKTIPSEFLGREVTLDFFLPVNIDEPSAISLLLINDGQNMHELGLGRMLEELRAVGAISPVLCVAIHAGAERKLEYGVASQQDYLGRGSKAGLYTHFILQELLPFIRDNYKLTMFRQTVFAEIFFRRVDSSLCIQSVEDGFYEQYICSTINKPLDLFSVCRCHLIKSNRAKSRVVYIR